MKRQATHWIHENGYAAKIKVSIQQSDDPWSSFVSKEDVRKTDRIRKALRQGDINGAKMEAEVFRLSPIVSGKSQASSVFSDEHDIELPQPLRLGDRSITRTQIRTGIGGWNFDDWRKTFYPKEVKKKDELEYASRALKTIEINSTYYRGQKPETFAKWRDSTPEGFVFTVKGNRFVTIKKVLAEAGESMEKFFATGVTELGDRLGPLLWQFAPTKKFDEDDFDAFLTMLPRERDGVKFRHAVEVRHESFCVPEFVALAKKQNVAIVYALHPTYPAIADVTSDFVYARLQTGSDQIETCYGDNELSAWAERLKTWHGGGIIDDLPIIAPSENVVAAPRDVFAFLISSGKSRAPAGAMALQQMMDQT